MAACNSRAFEEDTGSGFLTNCKQFFIVSHKGAKFSGLPNESDLSPADPKGPVPFLSSFKSHFHLALETTPTPCVHMRACVWVLACTCMCRPEIDFLSLFVHHTHLVFLRHNLSTAWDSPSTLGWLLSECPGSTRLYLPSTGRPSVRSKLRTFTLALGIELRFWWV